MHNILGAKLFITRNPHSIRSSCCLQVTRKPFYTFARRLWSLVNIELYWAPARHCQGLKQFCSWNVHNMKFYTLYFSLKYWPVTYVQWTLSISEFVLSWYQQNSWAAQLTVIERSAHTTWRRNTESLVFGLLWQSEGVLRSFTQADQTPVQLSQPKKYGIWCRFFASRHKRNAHRGVQVPIKSYFFLRIFFPGLKISSFYNFHRLSLFRQFNTFCINFSLD